VTPGAVTFDSNSPQKLFDTRIVGGGATATNAAEVRSGARRPIPMAYAEQTAAKPRARDARS
jgi:hypothetical protein